MKYAEKNVDQYTVISLRGDIDLAHAPEIRKQVLEILAVRRSLLVDLSAATYLDSSGVAVLVEAFREAEQSGLGFGLLGVSPAVFTVLKLSRLDQVFPIHASIEARLEADQA